MFLELSASAESGKGETGKSGGGLQQNLPLPDSCSAAKFAQIRGYYAKRAVREVRAVTTGVSSHTLNGGVATSTAPPSKRPRGIIAVLKVSKYFLHQQTLAPPLAPCAITRKLWHREMVHVKHEERIAHIGMLVSHLDGRFL
jgi:hypothetical protein